MRAKLERTPAPVVDAGLALAVALVVGIAIRVATEEDSRPPDVLAHLLGLAVAVPVLFRRRWPVVALAASTAIVLAYHASDYPAIAPPVPLGVVLYTAAASGHLRAAVLIVVSLYSFGTLARLAEQESALELFSDTVRDIALVGALLFLGDAVRSRRGWAAEVRERLRRAEFEREQEAQRRVAEERLRIARELHDVIAHTVSVITVQAGLAADVLDDRPDQARSALSTIRAAGREALNELKATVGVLRAGGEAADDSPHAPAPGLDQLPTLIEVATVNGLRVELDVDGEVRMLPGSVGLTAYRIVQESLTNVVRHAEATAVTVSLRYELDALELAITDDGRGGDGVETAGHGVTGMRERVAALGGVLEAGPARQGGFRVACRLPTGRWP